MTGSPAGDSVSSFEQPAFLRGVLRLACDERDGENNESLSPGSAVCGSRRSHSAAPGITDHAVAVNDDVGTGRRARATASLSPAGVAIRRAV
jgi:hypothetical protein